MKKGFTVVELLGVIVVLALLMLIAIPTYSNIQSRVKESIYESKVKNLLAKAEGYAEESGKMVFSINFLIENGIIEADNELGEFVDPRGDRDMGCDVVTVSFKDGLFNASLKESSECMDEEEIENMYGMIHINILDGSSHAKLSPNKEGWLKHHNIHLTYEFDDEYKDLVNNITSIYWMGEENITCDKSNLENCTYYPVGNVSVKQTNIILLMELEVNGVTIQSRTSKTIKLDMEAPTILDGSIIYNNDINTAGKRKVDFEITDNSGSGVLEYAVIKGNSCNSSEYNTNKKSTVDGIQTEYLGNGNYGICVKDKVGNLTSDDDLRNNKNRFTVENVDETKPVINTFTITSKNTSYNTLDVALKIKASDDSGTSGLKMCVSNTGYLKDCSWETYQENKNFKVLGDYDGVTRTIYLSIQDMAGNVTNRSGTYTVYKRCNVKTEFKEVSNNSNTCPKCGIASYTSNQENYDKYLGGKCNAKNVSKKCNIPNDCCATNAVNITWGAWSKCSGVCDKGSQSRNATATSIYNGQNCTTKNNPNLKLTETRECPLESCCSNNNLKYEYTSWSSCSNKCGSGTRKRTVTKVTSKLTGEICTKEKNSNIKEVGSVVSESCSNTSCCSSNVTYEDVGSWGPCSASCGPGTRKITVRAKSKTTGEICTKSDNSSLKTERSESCNLKACGPTVDYYMDAPGEDFKYQWVNINNFIGYKARVACGINVNIWSDPANRPSHWNYTDQDSCIDAQAFEMTSSGVRAGDVTTILSGAGGSGYRDSFMVSRFSNTTLGAIGISGYWSNSNGSSHYQSVTMSVINVSGTRVWASSVTTQDYGYVALDSRFSCNYNGNMCLFGKWNTSSSSGKTWYYEAYHNGSEWSFSEGYKEGTFDFGCDNRYNPDYCIDMRGGLIFDTRNKESKAPTINGNNHIFFDLPKYNHYGVFYKNDGKYYINFYEGQGIGKEFKLLQTKQVDRRFEKFMVGNYSTIGIAVDDNGKKYFYKINY